MVNPLKHANNLNQNDIENIYNKLCKEYEKARDFNTKKNLNQEILILILLCRRFPVKDLVKVGYDFFKGESHNSLLYKHLLEHSLKNYCQIDGLLLTNNKNQALTVEDIERILSDMDTGNVGKTLSVESLGITNSILNDFGNKKFNKKKVKKYLDAKSKVIEMDTDIDHNRSKFKDEDLKLTDRIIDEISARIIEHLEDNIPDYEYARDIQEVNEKQEILEDSLSNKYNRLYNKMTKIHQNIKSSNRKYDEFNRYFNEIALVRDTINTILDKQDKKLAQLEDKLDDVLEQMDEMNIEKLKSISNTCLDEEESLIKDNMDNNSIQSEIDGSNYKEIKEYVYNWLNHNLKISKNIHDTVSMEKIITNIEKDMENRNVGFDKELLVERMESYLSGWYNQHNPKIKFKDIKNTSIMGNEFYSNLKFINISEERENRIKNTIIAWLKENTCEVEGSKTYTQQIFEEIEPIFMENGWIITTQDEWKELHNAGFAKAVPSRTFSQIIGKAVQEVYQSISKDTIQRDTPSDMGVTWYPNIEILDKQVSCNLQSTIRDELSNDIFCSDNLIYNWLRDNLLYTGVDEDIIETSKLQERIIKHLQGNEIKISEKSLDTIFKNILEIFLSDYEVKLEDNAEIRGFELQIEYDDIAYKIIEDWIENHIIITGNIEDKAYVKEINEKVLVAVYDENINVVNDALYAQLPKQLRAYVITLEHFSESLKTALQEKINLEQFNDDINGSYYNGIQIISYKKLNREHIQSWIDNNIEELLKNNVASKKDIINNFKSYIKEHNIKNTTQHSIDKLLDGALDEYYSKINEISLKVLNDSQNEYYVLINA